MCGPGAPPGTASWKDPFWACRQGSHVLSLALRAITRARGAKDGASGGAMSRGTCGGKPTTRWVCLHIASGKRVSCHQQQPQDSLEGT